MTLSRRRLFAGLGGGLAASVSAAPQRVFGQLCSLGVAAPNTITSIPLVTGPFDLTRPRKPRPLWSEFQKKSENVAKLRNAYDKLRANSGKSGLHYQMCLHAYYCGMWPEGDVHHSWDFLPWHRGYLYFHERILAKAMGDPNFRLPAWDWEHSLPLPNIYPAGDVPSFLTGDCTRVNGFDFRIDNCVLQAWLFSNPIGDFVGGKDRPSWAYQGPHSIIHTYTRGTIANLATAAADPLFYMHHANIDRYWSYWTRTFNQNPTDPVWRAKKFTYYDEDDQPRTVNTGHLLDLEDLGYDYPKPTVDLLHLESLKVLGGSILKFGAINVPALITAAFLYAADQRWLTDPFAKFGELRSKGWQAFDEFMKDANFQAFPIQIKATLPHLTRGQYYLVELREMGANGRPQISNRAKIGGFGIFTGTHGPSSQNVAMDVIITGCLDGKALQVLATSKRGVALVYGPPEADGMAPRVSPSLNPVMFQILYPKGYLEKAAMLLEPLEIFR